MQFLSIFSQSSYWHGCRPSVRLSARRSVTDVLWLSGRSYKGKPSTRIISHAKLGHAKFQRSTRRGTFHFQIGNQMKEWESVRFLTENWSHLGNDEMYSQWLITNRKWHIRPVRWDGNHWPWMTLKVTDN